MNTTLSSLKALLVSKEVIYLNGLFHPVRSMPSDQYIVLALQVIDTSGAHKTVNYRLDKATLAYN